MRESATSFGITFDLAGKEIVLHSLSELAGQVDGIAAGDWAVGLPPGMRVDLGQIGAQLEAIVGVFDGDFRVTHLKNFDTGVDDLNALLLNIEKHIAQAHLGIEAFRLHRPVGGDLEYTLGLSITWPNEQDGEGWNLMPALDFKIMGLFLTVTNEGTSVGGE